MRADSPTSTSPVLVILLLGALAALAPVLADDKQDADKKAAVTAMGVWLAKMDAYDYSSTWDGAATAFKGAVDKDKWISTSTSVRTPLGKVLSRNLDSSVLQSGILSATVAGTYVMAQYSTSFENLKAARETVTFEKESDGVWRVAGYYIKPN